MPAAGEASSTSSSSGYNRAAGPSMTARARARTSLSTNTAIANGFANGNGGPSSSVPKSAGVGARNGKTPGTSSSSSASLAPRRARKDISQYRIGEHVYVGAPYNQREGGSPFMVCRIIGLHPATSPGEEAKITVNYYLRRRDVTNRNLADHRIVFATFMVGTVPLSHVRSRCRVMYRDFLEDPEGTKRLDDCFIFFQLYDRFMHKPFDLVPTSQVMNAPANVLEHLRTHYEFICTEVGTANDLCDATRSCAACHAFAARDDSVTCSTCSQSWHLGCLDPPLPRKPALGWRWNCIRCNMAAAEDDSDLELDVEDDADGAIGGAGGARKPTRAETAAAKRKAREEAAAAAAAASNGAGGDGGQMKLVGGSKRKGKHRAAVHTEGELDSTKWREKDSWPYRYFGQHVHYESITDPHDPIYPRASTRIGTRYQALQIPGEPEETHVKKKPPPPKKSTSKSAKAAAEQQAEEEALERERGGDDTVDVYWVPPDVKSGQMPTAAKKQYTDAEMDAYLGAARCSPAYLARPSVDILDHALQILRASPSLQSATSKLSRLTQEGMASRFPGLAVWTPSEVREYEVVLDALEDELGEFKEGIPSKTTPQIVHYFYRETYPSRQLLNADDASAKDKYGTVEPSGLEGEAEHDAHGHDNGRVTASNGHGDGSAGESTDEEESSLAGSPPPMTDGRRKVVRRMCAVCHVEHAELWYKCPDGVGEPTAGVRHAKVMCPSCAVQWRHYGNPTPALSPEEQDIRDARDGKKKKKHALSKQILPQRSTSPDSPYALSRNDTATPPPSASGARGRGRKATSDAGIDTLASPGVKVHPQSLPGFKPCVMCKRPEPKAANYQCETCGISVHNACYGIADGTPRGGWNCDICVLDEEARGAGEICCALCPPIKSPPVHRGQIHSALEALKPTEDGRFVHLFCGIWHQELNFEDPVHLNVVEGASKVDPLKIDQTCAICSSSGTGACLPCDSCGKWVHLGCAWSLGYRFCFEVTPLLPEREGQIPAVEFKGEMGDLRAIVICKDHPWLSPRLFYDMGQKDKTTGLTSTETYAEIYKSRESNGRFPLLLQARLQRPPITNPDGGLEGPPTGTDAPEPGSFRDIYSIKPPYIRKARKKRGQADLDDEEGETPVPAGELTNGLPKLAPAVNGHSADELSAHVPAVIRNAMAKSASLAAKRGSSTGTGNGAYASGDLSLQDAQPKKRKRGAKRPVSEDEASVSEDEVIVPSATTSRGRKAARADVRPVSKTDLLEAEEEERREALLRETGGGDSQSHARQGQRKRQGGHRPLPVDTRAAAESAQGLVRPASPPRYAGLASSQVGAMSAPIDVHAGWSSAPPLPASASDGTQGTAARYKLPQTDSSSDSTIGASAIPTQLPKAPGATYTSPHVVAIHQLRRVRPLPSSVGMASQKTGDSIAHKGRTAVSVAGQQYISVHYSPNALANSGGNINGKSAQPVGSSNLSNSPVSMSAGKPSAIGNGNGSGGFYSFASLNRQYPPAPPIAVTRRQQAVTLSEANKTSPGQSAPSRPSPLEGSGIPDDDLDGSRGRMRAVSSMSMSPT